MKSPIILTGKPFDWKQGGENMLRAVNNDGTVNWAAAFGADPGVMKCPNCGVYLWREGEDVQCPDCRHVWTIPQR